MTLADGRSDTCDCDRQGGYLPKQGSVAESVLRVVAAAVPIPIPVPTATAGVATVTAVIASALLAT